MDRLKVLDVAKFCTGGIKTGILSMRDRFLILDWMIELLRIEYV